MVDYDLLPAAVVIIVQNAILLVSGLPLKFQPLILLMICNFHKKLKFRSLHTKINFSSFCLFPKSLYITKVV